jgi:hypothetical protein
MDPFDDDDIALLLRLKRDEQPPASYYENFLSEFRRRQRDQLLRQSVLAICLERAQNLVLWLDVHSLASYPAAIAAVLVCGAVVSIRIYQQPERAQVTLQSSRLVSTRPPITDRELDFARAGLTLPFDTQPAVLRGNSRDIRMLPVLPAARLRSDEFVPLKLEWESLDDR